MPFRYGRPVRRRVRIAAFRWQRGFVGQRRDQSFEANTIRTDFAFDISAPIVSGFQVEKCRHRRRAEHELTRRDRPRVLAARNIQRAMRRDRCRACWQRKPGNCQHVGQVVGLDVRRAVERQAGVLRPGCVAREGKIEPFASHLELRFRAAGERPDRNERRFRSLTVLGLRCAPVLGEHRQQSLQRRSRHSRLHPARRCTPRAETAVEIRRTGKSRPVQRAIERHVAGFSRTTPEGHETSELRILQPFESLVSELHCQAGPANEIAHRIRCRRDNIISQRSHRTAVGLFRSPFERNLKAALGGHFGRRQTNILAFRFDRHVHVTIFAAVIGQASGDEAQSHVLRLVAERVFLVRHPR